MSYRAGCASGFRVSGCGLDDASSAELQVLTGCHTGTSLRTGDVGRMQKRGITTGLEDTDQTALGSSAFRRNTRVRGAQQRKELLRGLLLPTLTALALGDASIKTHGLSEACMVIEIAVATCLLNPDLLET